MDFRNCEKVIICLHQFQAKNVASDVSWIIKFAKTIQLPIVRILIIDVLITIKNGPSDLQTANTAEHQNNLLKQSFYRGQFSVRCLNFFF